MPPASIRWPVESAAPAPLGAFGTVVIALGHRDGVMVLPLSALRGALELLQDHTASMAPAERDHFLSQALADVARLDRLVRRAFSQSRSAPAKLGDALPRAEAALRTALAPFVHDGVIREVVESEALLAFRPA